MQVLLISDAPNLTGKLRRALTLNGFCVQATGLAREGLRKSAEATCDAVILDMALPDAQGMSLLRCFRNSSMAAPTLAIFESEGNARPAEILTAGADDCLTRPIQMPELVARLRALIRRNKGHASSIIRSGSLALNIEAQTAAIAEHELRLTSIEYQILETLALNKGKAVSFELLANNVYGDKERPKSKVFSVFMTRLRNKISTKTGGESYIKNIYDYGYLLQELPGLQLGKALL